jgi:hypothetical protein
VLGKSPSGGCKPLADLADVFLDFDSKVHELTAEAVNDLLFGKRKTVYIKLVEKLMDRVPVPTLARAKEIGRSLQATGICACLAAGRNFGTQCACWQQIEQEVGEMAATTVIDGALERLVGLKSGNRK